VGLGMGNSPITGKVGGKKEREGGRAAKHIANACCSFAEQNYFTSPMIQTLQTVYIATYTVFTSYDTAQVQCQHGTDPDLPVFLTM
jgi:hypothetical protein